MQPQNANQRQQAVPYKNVAQLLTEKALAIHQKAEKQAIWKGRPVATDGPMYTRLVCNCKLVNIYDKNGSFSLSLMMWFKLNEHIYRTPLRLYCV